MKTKVSLFWFRRDLRLEDNTGLRHALNGPDPVLPLFIFDTGILNRLEDRYDRRVHYMHGALEKLNEDLASVGTRLHTFIGLPLDIFRNLTEKYEVAAVYCNRDYEPATIQRDLKIFELFASYGIPFRAFKDQVVFDKGDILKKNLTPYTVYTPYAAKWKESLTGRLPFSLHTPNKEKFLKRDFARIPSLRDIGFLETDKLFKEPVLDAVVITQYADYRDYPFREHTSGLGMALRFGTVSIRKCVTFALKYSNAWLSELIWREFFMQILYHFPYVVKESFKKQYDHISWRNNEEEFRRWCEGTTGYAFVDAGMRQLNQTGYMHNRARMVAAGFLCKHLLIDWRWGEAYFARRLNGYDLAANNGNWQWAAGSGCDAAPYFRVFNPLLQAAKFDKNHHYIKRWVPEWNTDAYPGPLVEHEKARKRALEAYRKALFNSP